MTWMLTGGAGYIGGHIVAAMHAAGRRVVVLDDLSDGDPTRLPADVPLVQANVLDTARVAEALREHGIDGVIHLAAKKAVGESVERPLWYYEQNVTGTQSLLTAMDRAGVRRLVFSSSSSVYGDTTVDRVTEDHPFGPVSPYGQTKVIGEWLIRAQGEAVGMSTVSLRYFNVAGAATPALGDRGVFNLIPLVFRALSTGGTPQIFGDDYPTPDGTCIRDYIDVADLAEAHVAAVLHLDARVERPAEQLVFNVGTERGTSVREVMDTVREVTGIAFTPAVVARRAGDPARVVATADRIAAGLGWRAKRDLHDMVAGAWAAWQART